MGQTGVQPLPFAALAATAASTRWTCSPSAKDGEGPVPDAIADRKSATSWVKVCS
jgi:hypothetical protein